MQHNRQSEHQAYSDNIGERKEQTTKIHVSQELSHYGHQSISLKQDEHIFKKFQGDQKQTQELLMSSEYSVHNGEVFCIDEIAILHTIPWQAFCDIFTILASENAGDQHQRNKLSLC